MLKFSEFIALDYNEETNMHYLFDLENGKMFQLNQTASQLLKCIQETGGYDDYIVQIVKQTSVDPKIVESDVQSYLHELIEKGYLFELHVQ